MRRRGVRRTPPDLVVGVHTVCLAYLLYTSRLVPRFIGGLGLVGGPLIFLAATGVLFGRYPLDSPIVPDRSTRRGRDATALG